MSDSAIRLMAVPFVAAQPQPVGLMIGYHRGLTIITREWLPGDSARCNRCPTCTASERGTCTVVAEGTIPPESAAGHVITRPL